MRFSLSIIEICIIVAVCCAVCGGVTVNGKHHQVGCSCEKGVIVE